MCYIAFFFLFTVRPPPNSTLFPYTTLFRSDRRQGAIRQESRSRAVFRNRAGTRSIRSERQTTTDHQGRDRKSTRLNSSHRCISYAVFCLKKKKKKNKQPHRKTKPNTQKDQD